MDIVWEDPPEEAIIRSRSIGAKHVDFAIALRQHVDRWAVLPVDRPYSTLASAQSAAQNIRRGVTKAFAPKGTYDAVAYEDKNNNNEIKIHVKYLGTKQEAQGSPAEPATPPVDEDPAVAEARRNFAPRVRAWAHEKGIEVSAHGRLPQELIDHYLADTGDERPAHLSIAR